MVRYLLAVVCAALYVAGSIWIVRSQGQAYRAGLERQDRAEPASDQALLARNNENVARPLVTDSPVNVVRPEPPPSRPVSAPRAKATTKPAHASSALSKKHVAKAKPEIAHRGKSAVARSSAKEVPANPLARDAFWKQPQFAQSWDVGHLTLDDERRLGAELHELIVHFNPLVADPGPLLGRVEDAAEPFAQTLHRKEIKYRYFVLNSDVVNAFSTPGGYVYITRGFFDLIGEDEDYALQFALGHEIAHVDLQHAIRCLQDPDVRKMSEGTLVKLYMLILPFGYLESDSVDQEFEADEWVVNRMQRFGRTRREILVFLQKLEGYSKKHGFYDGRIKPQPGHDLSPVENHYRAQTAPRKRLKHLKQVIEKSAEVPK